MGQVNFCNGSRWGAICLNGWDHFDAAVVCRELGYTADGKSLYSSIHIQDKINMAFTAGAQTLYYRPDEKDTIIVIENVNCYWDELRLRDCPYSNYTILRNCQSAGIAGVRCKIISNIGFEFSTLNNSVLITWEYSTSLILNQPNSLKFNVRCNGQRQYTNIISVSNGTSRVSVGHLLPNASYDCCVSAIYARPGGTIITTELRCASIRSEDLLPPTTISDTNNLMATVTVANIVNISDTNTTATVVVGAVLGCVIVILLVVLSVCGGALFHLLRSRTCSSEVPKR